MGPKVEKRNQWESIKSSLHPMEGCYLPDIHISTNRLWIPLTWAWADMRCTVRTIVSVAAGESSEIFNFDDCGGSVGQSDRVYTNIQPLFHQTSLPPAVDSQW